jgi:hypothetical protein
VPLRTKAGAEAVAEEDAAPGAEAALVQGVAAMSPAPEAAVVGDPALPAKAADVGGPAQAVDRDGDTATGPGRHRGEP